MSLILQTEWIPTQEEFDVFAHVSGDDNPIHVDPEFSERTRFGKTVSHGMLIYSKLWALLQSAVPDARQTSQTMMFPNPCFVGDTVDLMIEELSAKTFALRAVRRTDGAEFLVGKAELA
ncbi:MAG: hydratase [Hyphomicrobiales bacterium]|nr:hydratase [Hyphomicrobiales bacterium]